MPDLPKAGRASPQPGQRAPNGSDARLYHRELRGFITIRPQSAFEAAALDLQRQVYLAILL